MTEQREEIGVVRAALRHGQEAHYGCVRFRCNICERAQSVLDSLEARFNEAREAIRYVVEANITHYHKEPCQDGCRYPDSSGCYEDAHELHTHIGLGQDRLREVLASISDTEGASGDITFVSPEAAREFWAAMDGDTEGDQERERAMLDYPRYIGG